ncbi:sulfite exporter TauE/SafE family protein [Nocardioides endophyticus]|uniref:sulfite exporter TauE/SafE family protein n=1 Tax=Nocardioides endophyticus TaxID=1353775 RepID=UPI003CD06259
MSYPALLAVGLPPVTANVTNTVALFGVTGGTIAGSQRELRGQGRRLLRLVVVSVLGGAVGAALLLLTPAEAFETMVPWLLGLGSLLLLARDRVRSWVSARPSNGLSFDGVRRTATWATVVFALGVYGGYFGAGVGIIALAALALERSEPLPVTNAVKNVATGAANGAAAITYILFAPVQWSAAIALGCGAVVGGLVGPSIVRVAPETALRWLVGSAGLLLAVRLATN